MTISAKWAGRLVAAGLVLFTAACRQPGSPSGLTGMGTGTQGGASGSSDMSGMGGMHGTAGAEMQTKMHHCADMRQQQAAGRLAPTMQGMLAECDQLDRQMGPAGSQPMPSATRLR